MIDLREMNTKVFAFMLWEYKIWIISSFGCAMTFINGFNVGKCFNNNCNNVGVFACNTTHN